MFAEEAEFRSEFARELPRFLAAIWQVFNQYELAGYVTSQRPASTKATAQVAVYEVTLFQIR